MRFAGEGMALASETRLLNVARLGVGVVKSLSRGSAVDVVEMKEASASASPSSSSRIDSSSKSSWFEREDLGRTRSVLAFAVCVYVLPRGKPEIDAREPGRECV